MTMADRCDSFKEYWDGVIGQCMSCSHQCCTSIQMLTGCFTQCNDYFHRCVHLTPPNSAVYWYGSSHDHNATSLRCDCATSASSSVPPVPPTSAPYVPLVNGTEAGTNATVGMAPLDSDAGAGVPWWSWVIAVLLTLIIATLIGVILIRRFKWRGHKALGSLFTICHMDSTSAASRQSSYTDINQETEAQTAPLMPAHTPHPATNTNTPGVSVAEYRDETHPKQPDSNPIEAEKHNIVQETALSEPVKSSNIKSGVLPETYPNPRLLEQESDEHETPLKTVASAENTSQTTGPQNTLHQQSNTLPQLSNAEHQPQSTTHQSLNTAHQPASTANQPPSTAHQPPSTAHRPPSTADRSTSTAHQSPSTAHQPPSTAHQSPSTAHRSPSTAHQSPSTAHQPTSAAHQPTSTAHQPTSTAHQPPSTAHQPTSTAHKPTSTAHQPASTAHRPTSTAHQPASTANQPPSTPSTALQSPSTELQSPNTAHQPPITGIQPQNAVEEQPCAEQAVDTNPPAFSIEETLGLVSNPRNEDPPPPSQNEALDMAVNIVNRPQLEKISDNNDDDEAGETPLKRLVEHNPDMRQRERQAERGGERQLSADDDRAEETPYTALSKHMHAPNPNMRQGERQTLRQRSPDDDQAEETPYTPLSKHTHAPNPDMRQGERQAGRQLSAERQSPSEPQSLMVQERTLEEIQAWHSTRDRHLLSITNSLMPEDVEEPSSRLDKYQVMSVLDKLEWVKQYMLDEDRINVYVDFDHYFNLSYLVIIEILKKLTLWQEIDFRVREMLPSDFTQYGLVLAPGVELQHQEKRAAIGAILYCKENGRYYATTAGHVYAERDVVKRQGQRIGVCVYSRVRYSPPRTHDFALIELDMAGAGGGGDGGKLEIENFIHSATAEKCGLTLATEKDVELNGVAAVEADLRAMDDAVCAMECWKVQRKSRERWQYGFLRHGVLTNKPHGLHRVVSAVRVTPTTPLVTHGDSGCLLTSLPRPGPRIAVYGTLVGCLTQEAEDGAEERVEWYVALPLHHALHEATTDPKSPLCGMSLRFVDREDRGGQFGD